MCKKVYILGEHRIPYSFFNNGHDEWIVDFVDKLFQNMLDISLKMLEDKNVLEFPIAYSERQAYSTIANAIAQITPYHLSEMYIGKMSEIDSASNGTEKQVNRGRYVDFWCRCVDERKIRDIWIECKRLHFNIGKNSKLQSTATYKKVIKYAIKQLETIADLDKKERDRFKIVFFSIYLFYYVSQKPEELDVVCKMVCKKIEQELTDKVIIYSVVDLRETIKDNDILKEWKEMGDGEKKEVINNNPYQIFLESSIHHQSDKVGCFIPFILLVAAIEEF